MGHLTAGRPDGGGFVGVVCGLRAEADCLERAIARAGAAASPIRVGVSGARPDIARSFAEGFVADGALWLVSFGIAGALDPSLAVGDLIAATAVTDGHRRHPCRIPEPRSPAPWRSGLVHGSDVLVGAPEAKAAMAPEGALTVDMESHQVAAVATAAGVPVTVLRAVSDRCDQRIPAYLARAVTADGRPRLAPVVTGLVRAPASLGDLLVLGRSTRHALAALEAAADPLLKALSAAIAALPANPAIAAKPRSSG